MSIEVKPTPDAVQDLQLVAGNLDDGRARTGPIVRDATAAEYPTWPGMPGFGIAW